MECKVSDLVKRGHDQAAELKSSCGAVDVRDVAQLISDLATQLDVQLVRSNALAAEYARIAEQREYYEGVIADGSKRIAELEAKLETADKLQDSAFRDGLKAGFSSACPHIALTLASRGRESDGRF